MDVTAKVTRAALRRHVLPVLRESGFDDGTPSRLWRHRDGHIGVIALETYSTYRALTDQCTTASFTVRLGISPANYSVLDNRFHAEYVKLGPKGPRPDEAAMPIRGVLCPSDAPALSMGRWGWEYVSMWRVDTPDDAEDRAADLASQLADYGLDWLTRGWDGAEIAAPLDRDEMDPMLISRPNGSHLRLDAGGKGTPLRDECLSMLRRGSDRDAQR